MYFGDKSFIISLKNNDFCMNLVEYLLSINMKYISFLIDDDGTLENLKRKLKVSNINYDIFTINFNDNDDIENLMYKIEEKKLSFDVFISAHFEIIKKNDDISLNDIERILQNNFVSNVTIINFVSKLLLKDSSSIILTGIYDDNPFINTSLESVLMLMKTCAIDLGKKSKIRCNSVFISNIEKCFKVFELIKFYSSDISKDSTGNTHKY